MLIEYGIVVTVCIIINKHMIILKRKEIVLVGGIYYMPDYQSLLNEFYCQFDDTVPDIPRVHEFLNYWKKHIDAVIKEVKVSVASQLVLK
jgi:uncharacterized protein Usg